MSSTNFSRKIQNIYKTQYNSLYFVIYHFFLLFFQKLTVSAGNIGFYKKIKYHEIK